MAIQKSKRSALGNNPLSQGIFTKTTNVETAKSNNTATAKPQANKLRKKNQDSRFLIEERQEKVNLRLTVRTNDWLDELLKQGRRKHGHKIPKEVWVQAALELLQAMPIEWENVSSEEHLRDTLLNLESRIKNQES
ncbi:hypothetical protein HRE53_33135 (plasmid) [Acaryochloris sp. 'Moss Beach']|uniref:hypothetical protein n=1 Tax=Acaryochloris sp. 'Moss Beach' TaxID=2740837 RepID=UPI001F4482CB|nr:hypothetical protein [Acaryochloris sp. 'Moss Beach']UJB73458.1 hypothetical protein HRE53_33135 [Acaryochloris sp. 'Moss Beach']